MVSQSLNLFPSRAAIGQVNDPITGKKLHDVYMTPEYARALAVLLDRVGGENSIGIGDLELLIASTTVPPIPEEPDLRLEIPADPSIVIADLSQQVADLQLVVQGMTGVIEQIAEIRSFVDMFEVFVTPQAGVDWEHPGKLGERTPNSVKATTLDASGATTLAALNATGATTLAALNAAATTVTTLNAAATTVTTLNASGAATLTSVTATGTVSLGTTGAAGLVQLRRASDGAVVGTDTMVLNVREMDNAAGDFIIRRGGVERIRATATGAAINGTATVVGGATMLTTSTALTNGAGAALGTLANAPAAGNPTKWVGINDNGTVRYIPTW
jgi:hypothetical protein